MKLNVKLNSKSIGKTIKELEKYKASLSAKNIEFINSLLDIGIEVAERVDPQGYGKFILFTKKVEGDTNAVGYFIGEGSPITVEWIVQDNEVKTAEIDPLLMSEFGSGQFAEVLFDISGVGRGTFPGQTHAFEDRWYAKKNINGEEKWVAFSGVAPKHPMYHADMEMINNIRKVAKEVFANGQ